jgi:hypothetical protein
MIWERRYGSNRAEMGLVEESAGVPCVKTNIRLEYFVVFAVPAQAKSTKNCTTESAPDSRRDGDKGYS